MNGQAIHRFQSWITGIILTFDFDREWNEPICGDQTYVFKVIGRGDWSPETEHILSERTGSNGQKAKTSEILWTEISLERYICEHLHSSGKVIWYLKIHYTAFLRGADL